MPQYSVNFDEKFDQALTKAANDKGTTKADIIRKAVASYIYLNNETAGKDQKVSITNDKDVVVKDVVLP